jgi:RTX calcium-binding nonapeptide repeat (4 copies)
MSTYPTAGDDHLLGTVDADVINALGGNDTVCSYEGNDTLDGGGGLDTAVYDGSYADYEILRLADGSVRVVDVVSAGGDEGADTLFSIESLQFADYRLDLFGSGESRVNVEPRGDQSDVAISAVSSGGWVAVWSSQFQDGNRLGIFSRRYAEDGSAIGGDRLVNSYTGNEQYLPATVGLQDGGYVVVWSSGWQDAWGYGIYGQRYDANGVAVGSEFLVNSNPEYDQRTPSVAALAGGGYVVTWMSYEQDGSQYGVYTQCFDVAGARVGPEVRVNTFTSGNQYLPEVAGLSGGGYVITWTSYVQDGSDWGVYAQRYGADGVAIGQETRVNTYLTDSQNYASVVGLSDGGYVVIWQSWYQDGSRDGIYGQRYDGAGVAVGGEFKVSTTSWDDQSYADIAALPNGGFVVTWSSYGQDSSNWGIYAQLFNAAGERVGDEKLVNTYTAGGQIHPAVAGLPNGGYVVSWQSSDQDGSGYGVYQQRFDANGDVLAGDFGLKLIGTTDADGLIWNRSDAVRIESGAGTDTLAGGSGADSLIGGDGGDSLSGGAGDDVLDGGDGQDAASYAGSINGYRLFNTAVGELVIEDIDLGNGNTGRDVVSGVEALSFADGAVRVFTEQRVNTTIESDQHSSSMTALADGG